MELRTYVVDSQTSRTGRWLRARRIKIALWIAVAEAVLVVAGVVPVWAALFLAAAVIGLYLAAGRGSRSDTTRQLSWIGAASQACVALVPVLVVVVGALALVAVAVLAVVALFVLFADRR